MSRPKLLLAALLAASTLWSGCGGLDAGRSEAPKGPRLVRSKPARASPATEARQEKLEEDRLRAYAEFATGLSYDERDDADQALHHYGASALADPSYEPLVIDAARRHLHRKQPDKAIPLLRNSASRPDASALVLAWLGFALAQAEHLDEAVEANLQALRKAPAFLMPYQNLFQIHMQRRQYPEVLKLLEQAAKLQDADPVFCIELASLCAQHDRLSLDRDKPSARYQRTFLDRAAAHDLENPLLLERLADGYAQVPDGAPKAIELYQKLIAKLPNAITVHEKLFRLLLKAGRKAEATAHLEAIRREQPTNPAIYYFLGNLASEEKRYDLAIEHFATAIRLNPAFEPVYYDLATVYLLREQPQDALDLLKQARSRFKARFLLEYYAALAHGAKKDYQEAIKCYIAAEVFAKAAEPERLTHIFYFQYGAACERAGDFADAEKYFRRSLELNNRFPEALNYLGYMWAERGQNLEEAHKLISAALLEEPENGAFLDSMAWVLYQQKKPAEALPWIEKSIARTEEPDATLFDHLGDILAALNRNEEARKAWQRALDIQPDDKIRSKLAR
jgi:tetratricopeptide (TPR) repeat protein